MPATKGNRKKKIREYEGELVVKGFAYHLSGQEIEDLAERVAIHPLVCELAPEPDNEFDPNAIRVYGAGKHLCYIARPVNIPLNRFLELKPKVKACELTALDPETNEGTLFVSLRAVE